MTEKDERYRLTEKGIEKARRLLLEKQEARDFFFGLVTNDIIKYMRENYRDPVGVILKILDTDIKLRQDGLDWESYLMRLKKTSEGYILEE